jgi:hypothetical protein
MKKLLVLTAVVVLTACTAGCRCDWFRRGALYPGLGPPAPIYEQQCPPASPCDPCDSGAAGGYTTTPVLPGP